MLGYVAAQWLVTVFGAAIALEVEVGPGIEVALTSETEYWLVFGFEAGAEA